MRKPVLNVARLESFKALTSKPSYYIVEVDTLLDDQAYDSPTQPGLKAYSIIKVDESGAHEVDRAYRNVREALEAWPHAVPPIS